MQDKDKQYIKNELFSISGNGGSIPRLWMAFDEKKGVSLIFSSTIDFNQLKTALSDKKPLSEATGIIKKYNPSETALKTLFMLYKLGFIDIESIILKEREAV
jgi:hypothetical protein